MIRRMGAAAVLAMAPGAALAQQQGQGGAAAAEAQLSRGFLNDQNQRLASQEDPKNASFTVRASAAIARKDYAGALAILRPYKLEQAEAYRYLAGIAYAGLGDAASSRKQLTLAQKSRARFLEATISLGEMEGQIGDTAAAASILADLSARQAACGGTCKDAAALADGVTRVQAAIAARKR